METPIQGFSRVALTDHNFEGSTLPAMSRVIVLYGSGNRDERKWDNPERFDITRANVADHLAFGHGEHSCVGMNLARLEISALLTALAKRVKRFELHGTKRVLNNTLRGFETVDVTVS
jgi:cytochrome P450